MFIKRTRVYFMGSSIDITAENYIEAGSSVTLSLHDFDIVVTIKSNLKPGCKEIFITIC